MVVAGAIVEKVSRRSYYDYVQENVYQRAGMTNSASYWKTDPIQDLAKGYTVKAGHPMEMNFSWLSMRGSPAGGGYSTVADLLRFANALTTHQLLDRRHTTLLITPTPSAPADRGHYGH